MARDLTERGLVDRALNGGHPTFEWLHKDAESPVGYVFPAVPGNVTPVKLIVREYERQTASFDLPK